MNTFYRFYLNLKVNFFFNSTASVIDLKAVFNYRNKLDGSASNMIGEEGTLSTEQERFFREMYRNNVEFDQAKEKI
jgi:hypothetical protein